MMKKLLDLLIFFLRLSVYSNVYYVYVVYPQASVFKIHFSLQDCIQSSLIRLLLSVRDHECDFNVAFIRALLKLLKTT